MGTLNRSDKESSRAGAGGISALISVTPPVRELLLHLANRTRNTSDAPECCKVFMGLRL